MSCFLNSKKLREFCLVFLVGGKLNCSKPSVNSESCSFTTPLVRVLSLDCCSFRSQGGLAGVSGACLFLSTLVYAQPHRSSCFSLCARGTLGSCSLLEPCFRSYPGREPRSCGAHLTFSLFLGITGLTACCPVTGKESFPVLCPVFYYL